MTLTLAAEVPEHGSTPSNGASPDVAHRKDDSVTGTPGSSSNEYINTHQVQKTSEMTDFMDDLCLNSPNDRPSRSRSRTQSSKRTSSSSSSSSSSGSSSGHSSWSRSRSRSRDRKYRPRRSSKSYSRGRSRSYSSSYSRSRSRSYSPRHRRRHSPAYRRYYRSPPRYRSRSRSRSYHRSRYTRSRSRSYHRSRRYTRSRSRSRGGRFYGFVRPHYSPYRSWRSRSRSRSRGRTLRLSEKEKLELLEIAKMNASKILGKQVELPESIKRISEQSKSSAKDEQRSDQSRSASSSLKVSETNVQEKGNPSEVHTELKHKSPYLLWRPVTSEAKSFSKSLSPKESHKSRHR